MTWRAGGASAAGRTVWNEYDLDSRVLHRWINERSRSRDVTRMV